MEEFGQNAPQGEFFSKALRAGKRTYFFDVKATRANELFLTITESKKRFNQQTGHFFFEKHKLFIYQEDFESFQEIFQEAISEINQKQKEMPIVPKNNRGRNRNHEQSEDDTSEE